METSGTSLVGSKLCFGCSRTPILIIKIICGARIDDLRACFCYVDFVFEIMLDCLHTYLPPSDCKDVVMESNVILPRDQSIRPEVGWPWWAELGKGNQLSDLDLWLLHLDLWVIYLNCDNLYWKLMQYRIVDHKGFLDPIFVVHF